MLKIHQYSQLCIIHLSACLQYKSLILACLHFAVQLSSRYQGDLDSTHMHFIYYKSSFNYLPFSRHICLHPANTINYMCFRYQYYKCIYYITISKTKANVLVKRTLKLGLAKISTFIKCVYINFGQNFLKLCGYIYCNSSFS